MDTGGKISVIIPAYNVEEYLEECVSSVIAQTYKNLEIIIVDDGSKDNTLLIAKRMQKNDDRIKVIHKENGGLPFARNVGLSYSNGDYILFLDSDDWLEVNCCSIAIEYLLRNKADIVFFDYYREYKNKTVQIHTYGKRKLGWNIRGKKEFNLYDMRTITAWGKLYTRACIENINFDESMRTAEDVDFNFRIYQRVNCAVYIPKCLLHYRILEKSAIHGYDKNVEKKFEHVINVIKGYSMGQAKEIKKAYYSFLGIAYIVICQNKYCLDSEMTLWKIQKEINKYGKREWVQDLFHNIKMCEIPFSRKMLIVFGKFKNALGIVMAVKIKGIIRK